MSGAPARETVMQALLQALTSTLGGTFTADTQAGSATLSNVRNVQGGGLLIGFPVVGGTFPDGTVISALSPLTLSQPATQNATQLSFIAGIQTSGRRVLLVEQVQAQPAVFVRDMDEDIEYAGTVLSKQLIKAEIWLYANSGKNPNLAPAVMLNYLIDGVQKVALAPDDSQTARFTLAGLVFWCHMHRIMKQPGDIDGQAMAVIDVDIIVP